MVFGALAYRYWAAGAAGAAGAGAAASVGCSVGVVAVWAVGMARAPSAVVGAPVVPAATWAAEPPGASSGVFGVIEPPLEATQAANSACGTTLIWIGMKA